jgi:hypothetical protein
MSSQHALALANAEESHTMDFIADHSTIVNTCIYLEMLPMQALGHNPHIYALSAQHFRDVPFFPDHLLLNFVCMALGHRMLRVAIAASQGGSSSTVAGEVAESTKKLTAAYYRYRCLAIQSLNEDLGVKERRESDFVLAGVLMVFLVDVGFHLFFFLCREEGRC